MAATEKKVPQSSYTWFHSPTATLSLCVYEQRQKIAKKQQDIDANEESIDRLKLERIRLITDLQPHRDYKAAFDTESAEIHRNIAIVQASSENEETKSARIRRMKESLQLCQIQLNKTGIAAHIKQQEQKLKELDVQIQSLEQCLEQQKVDLSSLQSVLTQAEQELERKKPMLIALSVKCIKNVFTSLNEKSTTTLVR